MDRPDPILDHIVHTSALAGARLQRTPAAAWCFWHACERGRLLRGYVRAWVRARLDWRFWLVGFALPAYQPILCLGPLRLEVGRSW